MAFILKQKITNFLNRDLIHKEERKLQDVLLIGRILIILGIIHFSFFLLPSGINNAPFLNLDNYQTPSRVSIAFFTTMLGVAFEFTSMLKDQTKDRIIMRVITFMFVNIITFWRKNYSLLFLK